MSHILLLGAERGGGGGGGGGGERRSRERAYAWYFTVYLSSKNKVDDVMQFTKWTNRYHQLFLFLH